MMNKETPQREKSPLASETPFRAKDQLPTMDESPFGPPFITEPVAFTSGPANFISGPSIFTSGPSAFTSVKTVFTAGPPAFSTSAFESGPVSASPEQLAFAANDNVALMSAFNSNPVNFASNQSAFTPNISLATGSADLVTFGGSENIRESVVDEWDHGSKHTTDPSSSSILVTTPKQSDMLLNGSSAFHATTSPTSFNQEQLQPSSQQQQPPLPPILPPPPLLQQQQQRQQRQQQQRQFQNLITEGLERVMYAPQPIQTDPFGSIPFRSMTPTPNASPSLSPRRLRADSPFAKSLSPSPSISPSPSPSPSPLLDAAAAAAAATVNDNQLRSLDDKFTNMCLSTNVSQQPTVPTAGVMTQAIPPAIPPPPPVPPSSAHHHHHHHHYQLQHCQYQSQPQRQITPQPSPSPPPPPQQQYLPHLPPPPRSSSHSPINVSPLLSPATIAAYQQQQETLNRPQVTAAVFSFTSSPPSPSSDSSATLASSINEMNWNPNFAAPNPNSLSPAMSPSSSFNMLPASSAGASSPSALGTATFATKPRSASVRRYRRRADQDAEEEMRPRTSSMPTKNTCRKPQMLGPPPWQADTDEIFVEPSGAGIDGGGASYGAGNSQTATSNSTFSTSGFYRLRSFATTSKGVVNRGDSLITNCSWVSPNNSVSDYPSTSESTYSLSAGQILRVSVLGCPGVGKASIIQQLMTSEYMGWSSTDSCEGNGESKCVSVLLDNEESMVDFTKLQSLEVQNTSDDGSWELKAKELPMGPDIDAYVIVFGIDDRRSFSSAAQILYQLRRDDVNNSVLVLVANKVDLVRNRVITTEEAKAVASNYECKYIEVSTILNHNLDELLVCLVTQIRQRQRKARSSHERSSQKSRSPVSPKHLFNKLFRRGSISKSYENLSEN